MINITLLCKKFNRCDSPIKKPAHFLQLNQCKEKFSEIKVVRGTSGGTWIPKSLGKAFVQWLSPELSKRLYEGEHWETILDSIS